MFTPLKFSFKSLFLLLATIVSAYAVGRYWIYADAPDGMAIKFSAMNTVLVYSHFIGASVALFLGAIQLFTGKGSHWHKRLGIGYCLGVLVGGIGGGYLSFFADAGPYTNIGFFTLAILWFYCTFRALQYARLRHIEQHRRWIIRSLALTAAAITLRIELPLLTLALSFETSYLIVAWTSWLGNLLIAELYLHYTPRHLTFSKGNLSL